METGTTNDSHVPSNNAHPINNEENKDEIIPENATCRICRGEATIDNPLFHPCRCKGSIKYLHEPCLLEWISARHIDINKPGTSVECDICHYPFQFKTNYDENMPEKIPLKILIFNFFQNTFSTLYYIFTMTAFFILLLIGLPLLWNTFGKLFTFMIDGKLPYERQLLKSMIFGFEENVPDDYTLVDVAIALVNSQNFSMMQIVATIILHLALYFQYDMIVREDIFNKMVFHKIGPNLSVDALRARLKEKFPMMDDETLNHVAKLVSEKEIRENERRNPVNEVEPAEIRREQPVEPLDSDDEEEDADFIPDENESQTESEVSSEEDGNGNYAHIDDDEIMREDVNRGVQEDNFQMNRPLDGVINAQAQRQFDGLLDRHRNMRADAAAAAAPAAPQPVPIFEIPQIPEQRFPQRLPVPANEPVNPFANPEFEMGDNVNNDGGQLVPVWMNLQIKLSNIFLYFIICVVFSFSYVMIAYSLPTVTGLGLIKLYTLITVLFFRSSKYLFYYSKLNVGLNWILQNVPGLKNVIDVVSKTIALPLIDIISQYLSSVSSNSAYVRAISSVVTFSTTIVLICYASERICKGYSRFHSMNNKKRRFAFQLLYAFKCTFKVFIIFFIELAGFPILAGAMLDFSLFAPILGGNSMLLWFPTISIISYQNFFAYWVIGTMYMYWFAKYIGMIRKDIIRPGVLFFIRSPEDPNTKILHDSLIHPLGAQLSRLLLSMFIYAVFIVLGFGLHTRVLFPLVLKSKLLTTPEGALSGYFFNKVSLLITFYFTKRIIEANPNVNVVVRSYWSKIFEVSSRKLRLSSFIIGTDYASERGHVVYRNIFYKFFNSRKAEWSNPELYSVPKTSSEVAKLFKEDKSVHAYFVPDGLLMRVPSSDIVSRNYVQTMFVPVTKNDKILKPLDLIKLKEKNLKNAGEFGYLDEQNTDFDDYFICYVPPHFRARYISLMILIWFFASVIIISTAIVAQYLFNTLTIFGVLLPLKLFGFHSWYNNLKSLIFINYHQINIHYVCIGAVMMSFILDCFKKYNLARFFRDTVSHPVMENNANNDVNEVQVNEEQNAAARPGLADLIFHNVISKFVMGPLLLCCFGVADYITFGLGSSIIVRVCIEYILFIIKGYPIDIVYAYTDIHSELYYLINLVFMRSIVVRCVKIVYGMRTNDNPSVLASLRQQWVAVVKPHLAFVIRCYLIFFFILCFTGVLEWVMGDNEYDSILDAFKFISLGRLQYSNASVPWSFAQHLTFVMIITVISLYILTRIYSVANNWFRSSVQNVKDEVYAKGRSLENYGANNPE
ncbi:hypothetical protein C6P45_003881 [Maudiozyma exigua]|uniref:RING-type E3 ubiquitin transferase n=1 Tax=Maudiozyma exigua TaxID=34358 RepID=A0A9P6WCM9_MAUEX|nr:hypothetical protein C6P45_003881 [Kazachstania exigua]